MLPGGGGGGAAAASVTRVTSILQLAGIPPKMLFVHDPDACVPQKNISPVYWARVYMGLLPDAPEAARIFSAGEPDNAQKRLNAYDLRQNAFRSGEDSICREPTNFEPTAVQPIRRLRKLLQYARQLPDWQDCLHGYRQPNSSRLGRHPYK